MIEDLISRVFYARNLAHWAHWRTKSYAQHQALGGFYDDVIDALDELIEAHQAVHGLVGDIPAPAAKGSEILPVLRSDAAWIEQNHEKICEDNRAIANLIDGVTGVYLKAIYKLENLK